MKPTPSCCTRLHVHRMRADCDSFTMSGFGVIAVLLLVAIAKLGYFFLSARRQDWKNRVAAMRQAQGQGQGQGGSYQVLQHASASAQACSKVVVTGAGTYLGRRVGVDKQDRKE